MLIHVDNPVIMIVSFKRPSGNFETLLASGYIGYGSRQRTHEGDHVMMEFCACRIIWF